eukprot:2608430-Rhodomonas_salina.1
MGGYPKARSRAALTSSSTPCTHSSIPSLSIARTRYLRPDFVASYASSASTPVPHRPAPYASAVPLPVAYAFIVPPSRNRSTLRFVSTAHGTA